MHLSLTLLVRYRSRDVFSLGGRWPPTSHTISKVWYSGLWASPLPPSPTGLSPSLAAHSRALRVGGLGWTPGPSPHISMRLSPMDSVWAPPLSLAGTQGIPYWFLLLPLLGCFRSGGSRSQAKARDQRPRPKPRPLGDPIRRSPDQRPPAATRGFSQLATSFLGARAEASTGRRPQAQGPSSPSSSPGR